MTHHIIRPDIEGVAAAIAKHGLSAVQLNLESAGLPPLPSTFDPALCRRIRAAFDDRDLVISGLSGTFNVIDPDSAKVRDHVARFDVLARWCRELGCNVITACTGTRHPASMWRFHPENALPESWRAMVETMRQITTIAEASDVTIAFEPEVVNVVDTAAKARRLIEEVGSDHLRVVMDPANYFHPPMLVHMDEVLDAVFEQVGAFIALGHAKDVRGPDIGGTECVRPAAGTGMLDYTRYMRLLRASGFDGGLIMHSLSELEVAASAAYVRRFLDAEAQSG